MSTRGRDPSPRAAARAGVAIVAATLALAKAAFADGAAPSELREAVCADTRRAAIWNTTWASIYGVAAIEAGVLATSGPKDLSSGDRRAGLFVTAGKAGIGAVYKLVDPLRPDDDEGCATRGAAADAGRAALAEAARRERRTLTLELVGGLALNAGGFAYLGFGRHAWSTAWLSAGVGTAASIASGLTMPRRSWRLQRRWANVADVAAVPWWGGDAGGAALAVAW